MKFLLLFLLFFAAQIQAQTIDCQEFAKLSQSMVKTKWAIEMRSTSTTERGTMQTITEIDSAKRIHTVTKLPPSSPIKRMESIMIDSIFYSKIDDDATWTYSKMPPQATPATMSTWMNYKFKECRKVGSEVLDGLPFDIIETTVDSVPMISSMRFWVNFDKQILKKAASEVEAKGTAVKVEIEYKTSLPSIEKPLNAVAKRASSASFGQQNGANAPNVDNLPEYKDGMKALFAFLQSNLDYPKTAKDAKIEGTVYVGFTVAPDGTVCDVVVKRGIGYGCDEAAIEVVKKTSGKWSPAMSFGKPVSSPYTLPIKFK